MLKKPNGKRLNEHQRCETISKLSKTNAPSKRALAQEYNVSKGAIQKVWDNREAILEWSTLLLKKLELALDDLLSLKTCFTSGLTACIVPNCLSRHLSP
jgi:hypothetical protein